MPVHPRMGQCVARGLAQKAPRERHKAGEMPWWEDGHGEPLAAWREDQVVEHWQTFSQVSAQVYLLEGHYIAHC